MKIIMTSLLVLGAAAATSTAYAQDSLEFVNTGSQTLTMELQPDSGSQCSAQIILTPNSKVTTRVDGAFGKSGCIYDTSVNGRQLAVAWNWFKNDGSHQDAGGLPLSVIYTGKVPDQWGASSAVFDLDMLSSKSRK